MVVIEVAGLLSLAIAVGIPLGLGAVAGLFTARSIPVWYRKLQKPSWNPPDWVFGPVWTILYILMGVSSWIIYSSGADTPGAMIALVLYGSQLFLNFLWSIIFFGLRRIGWALTEITLLWVLIVTTMIQFFLVDVAAGLLLLPYLLWVTIATALNATIWRLNRAQTFSQSNFSKGVDPSSTPLRR